MKNILVIMLFLFIACTNQNKTWKVGVQAFTFHKFTLTETFNKIDSLGLNYVEVYYGQKLGFGDETFRYDLSDEICSKIKDIAKSKNIKIIASGVVICENEEEWNKLFQFVDKMNIDLITCEPKPEHLDIVENLADKYKINIAIHNHPQPSNYWNPNLVMAALEGRSKYMGVCADVGHWKREGIDPVNALKTVGSRLKSLHFKDIKSGDNNSHEASHDVVWGTGACNVKGMIETLRDINFNGLISIEYEYNWENSIPDIRKCINYLYSLN